MSAIKLPRGIFEAGASVQEVAEGAGVGLLPSNLNTHTDPYTIEYDRRLHHELDIYNATGSRDIFCPSTLIEVPESDVLPALNVGCRSPNSYAHRDFYKDGYVVEGRVSFLDVYRKWQGIVGHELGEVHLRISNAQDAKRAAIEKGEIAEIDVAEDVVSGRVVELYGAGDDVSDFEEKAEYMFRAGVGLLSLKCLERDAQVEEACELFFGAAQLVSDPDAKALILELGTHLFFHRLGRLGKPGNEIVPNLILMWQGAMQKDDEKYDPVRLFAALKWSMSTPDQLYNMRFLLENQEEGSVDAADNLVRAVWAQLKWFEVMYSGGGDTEVHTDEMLALSGMMVRAADIWMQEKARSQHAERLMRAAAECADIAAHIEDEHDGSYTLWNDE